jgi:site-specific DNA-methyltransferase (adenine-specific)
MLERTGHLRRNIKQHGDALTLLRALPDACSPLAFFDPQHRGVLDHLKFGNEDSRQRGRALLPAMTESYIDAVCVEVARVLKPNGYLMRWLDTYGVVEAHHLRISRELLVGVDLITWDNLPPIRCGNTWTDHSIPSRWPEKVSRGQHPHIKPSGLITRLIAATTAPGDLVVDPAAGSFVVMRAAHALGRNFCGCDLVLPTKEEETP